MATSKVENLQKQYGLDAVFSCRECEKFVVQVQGGSVIIFDKDGNPSQTFVPPDKPPPQALEPDFTCRYSPNCALNPFRDRSSFPPVILHPESNPQE